MHTPDALHVYAVSYTHLDVYKRQVISLAQVLFIVSAVKITLAPAAQLSVAVTVAGAGTNSTHNTVVSLGTPTNAGGILSFMVICCIQVVSLPQTSVPL